MNVVEITIQRKAGAGWPVVVEQTTADHFIPLRTEGMLHLDEIELQMQSSAREYGTVLGRALFQDCVRDALANALATSPDRLRVLLFVEADDLMTLRWERLCAPIDGHWDFLALHQRTLFSLYLPSIAHRSFPPIGRRDLRALILIASPHGLEQYGLERFDVATTAAQVHHALGEIPSDLLAHREDATGPPTLDALCEHIATGRYTLVHVVCHGQYNRRTGETSIFLADEQDVVQRIDGSRLLARLRQLQGEQGLPHFGFLAACESAAPEAEGALGGLGQRLVRELGVPAVIAMTDAVSVDTAHVLTAVFYRRLREHGEIDRALAEAMAGLDERDDTLMPALYSRLGARPLFRDNLTRDLTEQEIKFGLERLETLLSERAPVLRSRFESQASRLRATLHTNTAALRDENRDERNQALAEIDQISREATDMLFKGLALGDEPPHYDDRCPFRGLYAFQPTDHEFFFGREALVDQLVAQLQASNFLALLGASGSGKSSLVLAGLVPALQQTDPELQTYAMTPGTEPAAQLADILTSIEDNHTPRGQRNILLFVDQFEELFTLCTDADERQQFLDRLLMLIGLHEPHDVRPPFPHGRERPRLQAGTLQRSTPPHDAPAVGVPTIAVGAANASATTQRQLAEPAHAAKGLPIQRNGALTDQNTCLRVVITMRADFWGECASHPLLKKVMMAHQELIPAMGATELRRAMEMQAAAVGLRFEADLSTTILNDVQGEPGAMPLLQHLLLELWRRRRGRWLRAEEYRAIGGVQQAIARTADDVFNGLSPARRQRVRDIFVRLTNLDEHAGLEGDHYDTRRRVCVRELTPAEGDPTETKALLAQLADAKLVITGINKTTQEEEVEVVHEALIRHWPRLLMWLDEDRTRYRLRQAIGKAAQAWMAHDQHEDFLIHRGGQLKEAQSLAAEPGFLATHERNYIGACVSLQQQEQRRRLDAARRVAQASQAKRMAEENARLLAEQRANERHKTVRSLRRRAVVIAVAGMIALGTALLAIFFWQLTRSAPQSAVGSSPAQAKLTAQCNLIRSEFHQSTATLLGTAPLTCYRSTAIVCSVPTGSEMTAKWPRI